MITAETQDGCQLTMENDFTIGALHILSSLDINAKINAIDALPCSTIEHILYYCQSVKIATSDNNKKTLLTYACFVSEVLGW